MNRFILDMLKAYLSGICRRLLFRTSKSKLEDIREEKNKNEFREEYSLTCTKLGMNKNKNSYKKIKE